jgi:hypothetical protein
MVNIATEQVLAREAQRCTALLHADIHTLAERLSERLVFAHANATYEDKSSLLAKMGSGTTVYQTLQVSGKRVIELGDTALLISRLTAAITVGSQPPRRVHGPRPSRPVCDVAYIGWRAMHGSALPGPLDDYVHGSRVGPPPMCAH